MTADEALTVMIVDDEAFIRRVLRVNLESAGCSVLEASNGEAAWTLFLETQGSLALIITDVHMPRMGGLELAWRICGIASNLPIVLMTGSPGSLTGEWLRFPLIEKPFSKDMVLAVVQKVLLPREFRRVRWVAASTAPPSEN
jgi:two-component system cell cycle sensor histidine kinase/response regulator CckA